MLRRHADWPQLALHTQIVYYTTPVVEPTRHHTAFAFLHHWTRMHRRHQSLAPHAHLLLRCGSAVVTPDDYITEEQLRSLPSRRAWVVDVAGGAWGLRMVPIPPNGKRKIELPFPKSSVWEMSTLSSSKRRSQTIIARSSAFLLRWFHFCSACRKAYPANRGVLGRNSQVNACNRSRGYGILNLAMSYSAFVGTLIGV